MACLSGYSDCVDNLLTPGEREALIGEMVTMNFISLAFGTCFQSIQLCLNWMMKRELASMQLPVEGKPLLINQHNQQI